MEQTGYLVAHVGEENESYKRWRQKRNATKFTKLKIKYHNKFKTVLTNGNSKLFLGKTQT